MKNYFLFSKFKLIIVISLLFLPAIFITSCGQAGQKDGRSAVDIGEYEGIIGSSMGLYNVLDGWHLVLSEFSTKICKMSPIYNGAFSLKNVDKNQKSTLLLLTPKAKLHAVLSIPDTQNPTHIYQYFESKDNLLPPIILKYPVLNFLRTSTTSTQEGSLNIAPYFAYSKEADGVPDGMKNLAPKAQSAEEMIISTYDGIYNNQIDSDSDGIPNVEDNDILGSGVPNLFSTDIDQDGIIDIFDTDANADSILDELQPKTNKYYFSSVIEYLSVQQRYLSETKQYLMNFKVKINEKDIPLNRISEVSVYSITDLFVGSQLQSDNTPWDLSILDDGKYGDDIASDGIFSRTAILHQRPTDKEIIFIKVVTDDNTFFFPYIFSKLSFNPITPYYNAENRTISFDNLEPFGKAGGATNFIWSIWMYDQNGKAIFSSPNIKSKASLTYTLPNNIEVMRGYKIKVFIQSLDQIPGIPATVIESKELTLE